MKKVHILIFSRDRALQLDATLRSLLIHANQDQIASLSVLYRVSSPRFLCQYKQLIPDYPQVKFIEERDFRKDLIKIITETITHPFARIVFGIFANINGFGCFWRRSIAELIMKTLSKLGIRLGWLPLSSWSTGHYWLLTVDDNLFIRPLDFREIIEVLERNPLAIGFSLRLGENIRYCYMRDTPQKTPEFIRDELNPKILHFDWENAEHDFGYPLEISGTLYRSSLLVALIASLHFTSPNTLESKMASLKRWFARRYPKLICYSSSVAFCVPLNKVQQDQSHNRSGNAADYSIEGLAALFDEGKRVDLATLSQFTPNACHQEIELGFIQIPRE